MIARACLPACCSLASLLLNRGDAGERRAQVREVELDDEEEVDVVDVGKERGGAL